MSWKKVKLGEVLVESKIESKKSDPDKRITVRLNLKGVEKRSFEAGVEGATKYYIRKAGQFIYGKQNLFKGAFGIIPKELDDFESSSDIPTFDVSKDCLPEWLFYFFKQNDFYTSLESIATGTGSRRIQPSRLYEIEIPLPTIPEQKKIIESCNLAEQNFERINYELKQQQTYLQLLRQTILQEAVQGKLTKQDPTDEPATELLERIKAKKQKLIKAGKLKKEKELSPITEDEIPFELPKGWVWCRLAGVCDLITDGTHLTPHYVDKGRIFLSALNVKPFKFMPDKHKYVSEEDYQGYIKSRKAEKGDVLLTRVGAGIGEAAVVDIDIDFAFYVSLGLLKPSKECVYPYYLEIYLNSPLGRGHSSSNTLGKGVSAGNLNLSLIRNFEFPLPPLAEQKRIVAKVQQLQQQLSQLETQVQQIQEYARELLESVLREAFEEKGKVYEMGEENVGMVAED